MEIYSTLKAYYLKGGDIKNKRWPIEEKKIKEYFPRANINRESDVITIRIENTTYTVDISGNYPFHPPKITSIRDGQSTTLDTPSWAPSSTIRDIILLHHKDDTIAAPTTDVEQTKTFNLFVTAGGHYLEGDRLLEEYDILFRKIKRQIYAAGFTSLQTVYFDRFSEYPKPPSTAQRVYDRYKEDWERFEIRDRYLTYTDLLPWQERDDFLLLDLAHVTYYKSASIVLHEKYRVQVGFKPYDSEVYQYLNINAVYPTYRPPREIMEHFDFIQFTDDGKIITYIWNILEKRLTLRLYTDGFVDTVITNRSENGHFDIRFHSIQKWYSAEFLNNMIWSQPRRIG